MKADILAIRHDNDCGQLIDGKYYSPLIDSLLDDVYGRTTLTIASPYSYKVGEKSWAGALNFNGAFVRELLVKRLRRMMGLGSSEVYIDTWRAIIRSVRPKSVICIAPAPALCQACHEEGVYVYDMQHGYIGPSNPSYGEEFQVKRDRREMADCILCWDEGSAASIRVWTTQKQVELRVIGNPWVNKFLTRGEQDKVVRFFENHSQVKKKDANRLRILVSLQWGLNDPALTPDQNLFDNEFVPKAMEAVVQDTKDQYEWIFRPHPVQYLNGKTLKRLKEYVVDSYGSAVRVSENVPLPFVLSGTDLHITYNSSVVIEAELFGVPSAMLDPQIDGGLWAGYYSSQINAGIAKLLPCQEAAIQDWIHESCSDSGTKSRVPSVPQTYRDLLQELRGV